MKTVVSLISFLAFLLVALPGPLYKFEVLGLGVAFTTLRIGVYVGMAALALIIVQLLFVRKSISVVPTCIAAILALVSVALPVSIKMKGGTVPPIHDISTDLVNPPEFIAILPLRANAPNPAAYAGTETAAKQKQAYPELTSQLYDQPYGMIFNAAKSVVQDCNWALVNADDAKGIIEATDTTGWFGFKDDVVIRIKTIGNKQQLDVRSKSRVGRSDLGKNAERIKQFISALNAKLEDK